MQFPQAKRSVQLLNISLLLVGSSLSSLIPRFITGPIKTAAVAGVGVLAATSGPHLNRLYQYHAIEEFIKEKKQLPWYSSEYTNDDQLLADLKKQYGLENPQALLPQAWLLVAAIDFSLDAMEIDHACRYLTSDDKQPLYPRKKEGNPELNAQQAWKITLLEQLEVLKQQAISYSAFIPEMAEYRKQADAHTIQAMALYVHRTKQLEDQQVRHMAMKVIKKVFNSELIHSFLT